MCAIASSNDTCAHKQGGASQCEGTISQGVAILVETWKFLVCEYTGIYRTDVIGGKLSGGGEERNKS